MKVQHFFFLFFWFGTVSCQQPAANPSAPAAAQESAPAKEPGFRQVIFLTLSSEEMYEISLKEGEGALSVIDEFDMASQMFTDDPTVAGVTTQTTDAREVVLPWGDNQKFVFKREKDELKVGAILYDAVHEPKLIPGLKPVQVYREEAKIYFER
jgi:hypothetical protein